MATTRSKSGTPPHWLTILRTRMEALGLNPRSLSIQAGLNPTAVRDMLEGRTKFPRYDTLKALSQVLKMSPSQLMGDEIANENASFSDNLGLLVEVLTRLQEEMTQAGHTLPPRDFAAMAATIYQQMRKDAPHDLGPTIHDLLAYEKIKKRAQS